MYLCEKEIVQPPGVKMSKIPKLTKTVHPISAVTTNFTIYTSLIALYIFSIWTQEIFFRYMRQVYDIDRIINIVLIRAIAKYKIRLGQYNIS